MPVQYRIDPEQHLIRVTIEGPVTDREMVAYRKSLRADPAYRSEYSRLIDARRATSYPEPDVIRMVAQSASRGGVPEPPRRALVATSDVMYGMFRMLQSLTDRSGQQNRVFRSLEEAERWLAVAGGLR